MAAVEQGADKEKGLITSKSIKAKRNTSPPRVELIGGQMAANITPYNVGSVLWRLFSTLEVVQYIGGYSVHRGDNISTVGR